MAPTVPHRMAFFCRCAGNWRAARAITMALSPARTRSIRTMASRADHHGAERNSMKNTPGFARTNPGAGGGHGGAGHAPGRMRWQTRFDQTCPRFESKVLLGMESCRKCPTSRKPRLRIDDL